MEIQKLLDSFVIQSENILKDNLTGIYLHGSIAMGCFNGQKSDIDLIVVVQRELSNAIKRQYMDKIVELNDQAPGKGLELSVVRESACNPVIYPTPYELHFSAIHLNRYASDPEEYIEKMKGMDKDLAAHFKIIRHRGKTIYGRNVSSVFSEVSDQNYMDSVWSDVEKAEEGINGNPTYVILNLCRVLAYASEKLILSKREGGEWALRRIPSQGFKRIIAAAIEDYRGGRVIKTDSPAAVEFAETMLREIRDSGSVFFRNTRNDESIGHCGIREEARLISGHPVDPGENEEAA